MKKRKIRFKNIFIVIFLVYTIVTFINQQFTIVQLRKTEQEARLRIENVNKENEKLKEMINNASSPEYIEKMAREQLGLVKSGERVYIDQSAAESNAQNRDN
ncbi:MAG: FtsB family cell division protein [Caulobacteraceae bacterium]